MVSVTDKENPRYRRCQVLAIGPASMGDLLQCKNVGDHWETIKGCGCEDPDPDVCIGAMKVWSCSHTHIFPCVTYTPRDYVA